MLKGKFIVLGVTGSIAAYKTASLASMLVKAGASVQVIMTQNATNIINPITFETLTSRKCLIDTFDRNFEYNVEHVSLAKRADLFMIAPATANVIAKVSNGLADDMLTTTFLACRCKKIIVPAMNTQMLQNPITQDNLAKCRKYGMQVLEPAEGYLACGDTGKGKLPEPEILFETIEWAVSCEHDFEGKKVLVTAGPTQEAVDPVRYITNHSSGKMGYAIAVAARNRGADVTLVSGPVELKAPLGVNLVSVTSASQMAEAVKSSFAGTDIVIKAAAVADYRPKNFSPEKIKKSCDDFSIELERTEDILSYLGKNKKENQFLCGFSMETRNLVENSRAKLAKKNLDMVCANNLKVEGAGFRGDTNVITLITENMVQELPVMKKSEAAHRILDAIKEVSAGKVE